jgi:hypothetical protein
MSQAPPGQIGLDAERLAPTYDDPKLLEDEPASCDLDPARWVTFFKKAGGDHIAVQKARAERYERGTRRRLAGPVRPGQDQGLRRIHVPPSLRSTTFPGRRLALQPPHRSSADGQ